MTRTGVIAAVVLAFQLALVPAARAEVSPPEGGPLQWHAMPDLPDALGMAGPFVGVHNDALIVAGGANFPTEAGQDIWDVPKVWHGDAWVYARTRDAQGNEGDFAWHEGFSLPQPIGYGAAASTSIGVVCIGGEDGQQVYDDVFLLRWNSESSELAVVSLPSLPEPMAFGAATAIGDVVYVAGGQSTLSLDSATTHFYRLDLSRFEAGVTVSWERLPSIPGPGRAFNIVVAQHDGFNDCVYIISGRRTNDDPDAAMNIVVLDDVYEFNPQRYDAAAYDAEADTYSGEGVRSQPWRRRADMPRAMMAGTAIAVGQSHIFVLSGDAGELWTQTDALRDDHPGFERQSWAYHTITDTWTPGPETPANQVTTPAVKWGDDYIIASGEVRPRHRTAQVWRISLARGAPQFGAVNATVLVIYLAGVLGLGVWFVTRSSSTEDYFRGGQRVPWWVAGLSIYATMLSSITFMAIPARAFAQDWVWLMGNFMILAVAPIAVYVALPFFRRIDATSAYEYLEKRFNVMARLIGSFLFTLFHIFRMGIVMALAALALAVVTPMSPATCVLIIGLLSVVYCTLGGVEAVVWTDTLQTVVLMGGAIFCVVLMIAGIDGGVGEMVSIAAADGKLRMANFHMDYGFVHMALWVVVIGFIAQNIASYTADQAVVQRYLTTADEKRAAKAIWTNALIAVPGSILFFAMGAGLYVFYKTHPEKLDPVANTDQILPIFIAHELPVGVAGLVVAAIFAAAQSTVSTSMNSTATTIVTDFIRPLSKGISERGFLNLARGLTLVLGIAGTILGVMFVDPEIRSLWSQFVSILGVFMGVLGGLFCLGMFSTRTNGRGAIIGIVCAAVVMLLIIYLTDIPGVLYAFIGIATCFITGYLASLVTEPNRPEQVDGLTVFSLLRGRAEAGQPLSEQSARL